MALARGFVAIAVFVAGPVTAGAQESRAATDTAGIHTTLRAFYFHLAHRDWEAIAADVLSAKVVAHRPPPAAMIAAAASAARGIGGTCSSETRGVVEAAVLSRDGDWVEASVPHCDLATAGTDEFRLIRFEGRWRFVYIGLFEEPASVTAER